MIGLTDNGFTAEVTIGSYTTQTKGARVREGVATIAIMVPSNFTKRFPRTIMVDGREMTATSARKSDDVKGMLILTVDWVPEA